MRQMTFHVPDNVAKSIEEQADEKDISKSKVVRTLLQRGLEYPDLENKLEESRRREAARDKTKQEIDVLREELKEDRQYQNAPFFVRWWHWYND